MGKPILLYDNRFIDGTITATDTAADYDVNNIKDLRAYTFWKAASAGTKYLTVDCGSEKSADSLGIIGHNLFTAGAMLSVESSSDGSVYTERLAAFTPSSDKTVLKTFSSVSARYWRIKIVTATVAPQLAVVMLGQRITFERYLQAPFDPAPEKIEGDSQRSKTGNLLGSVVYYHSMKISADFKNVTPAWIRDTFKPAWDGHLSLLKPFFFAWDPESHPDEVFFVKVPENFELRLPYEGVRRSLRLEFEGVKE
jgi:hypothetical protein